MKAELFMNENDCTITVDTKKEIEPLAEKLCYSGITVTETVHHYATNSGIIHVWCKNEAEKEYLKYFVEKVNRKT